MSIFPPKLKPGDTVAVVAPAHSLALISVETREFADEKFRDLGLKLFFAEHAEERDEFDSSSIQARVDDLHRVFADPAVAAIMGVIGGFNANQLLRYLDWELIAAHPKILCGYSDITALNNAMLTKTGVVTYAGPHYSTFGQKYFFEYTLGYWKKCLLQEEPFEIEPSESWSDDDWYDDQENRHPIVNEGWLVINEGEASGTLLGSNLCTLNLLQGSEYFPDLTDAVLFLEDDETSQPHTFDRNLQSLLHLPQFAGVRGLVIGRFQKGSEMSNDKLRTIIQSKQELAGLPVLANVDFGHTSPMVTLPIGGTVNFQSATAGSRIEIVTH